MLVIDRLYHVGYLVLTFGCGLVKGLYVCASCGTPLSTPHNTVRENAKLWVKLSALSFI